MEGQKEERIRVFNFPVTDTQLVVGDVSMSGELRVFFLLLGGGRKIFYMCAGPHNFEKGLYNIEK